MVSGALSADHMIQLEVVTGTLNSQRYQDQILKSGIRSPLDSLDRQNMVPRDDIARPHCTRIMEEYKKQQNIASLPRPSLLPDLNPIASSQIICMVYIPMPERGLLSMLCIYIGSGYT